MFISVSSPILLAATARAFGGLSRVSGSSRVSAKMDVKCQGCFNITTVFSHSQTVVVCGNCQTVLCQPTGGRARLTEGCSFRRKGD
uniref:40S ribosomal protein S27 n=1 Tax=Nelumbo nucifera TaxID=4432 RepID=A0A822YR79_NELNU|nr:TPA_asm: hypothetical protein HUJ06_004701 [Nelumbo nucifera]